MAVTGVFSGMIGVTVGGSALISIPVMMMLGAGPLTAIATNKFSMFWSGIVASTRYYRAGVLPSWRVVWLPMTMTFIFALLGAWMVLDIPESVLTIIVIGLMLVIVALLVVSPDLGQKEEKRNKGMRMQIKSAIVFGGLGLYLGFFGPGYGTFAIMGLVYVYGFTFVQSSGTMNLLGFAGLLSSLGVFLYNDQVDFVLGIPLTAGVMIGGWLGAHFAVLKGNTWLRRFLILITLILIANLIYQRF